MLFPFSEMNVWDEYFLIIKYICCVRNQPVRPPSTLFPMFLQAMYKRRDFRAPHSVLLISVLCASFSVVYLGCDGCD